MKNLKSMPFAKNGIVFYPYEDFWAAVSWTSDEVMFLENINEDTVINAIEQMNPKYEELPPVWQGLCLYITQKCNLDCVYCYARGGESSKRMSWDTAKTTINYYLENKPHHISFTFHGAGEPTIEIDFIQKCCEYIEELYKGEKPIRYSIITNGVVKKETLDWLIDKGFRFSVSIDGIPQVQDKQRPLKNGNPSSRYVEKTIKRIVQSGLPYSVNGVFTSETYHLMEESVEYFANLGVNYMRLRHAFICGRCHDNDIKSLELDTYLKYLKKAKQTAFSKGVKIAIPGYNMPFPHRCGIGTGYFAGVSYEGFVTACTEVTSKNHPAFNEFCIGHVDVENDTVVLDMEKINKYRDRSYKDIDECQNCVMRDYCNGGCMIRCWEYSGNINKPDPNECKRSIDLFLAYIHEIIEATIEKNYSSSSS